MEDETAPPFPEEEAPIPSDPKETASTIQKTVTETQTTGKPKSDETMLGGASGRFWVTICSIIGATGVMILILQSDMQNETKAVTAGAYIALAASIANTYMGQNKSKAGP